MPRYFLTHAYNDNASLTTRRYGTRNSSSEPAGIGWSATRPWPEVGEWLIARCGWSAAPCAVAQETRRSRADCDIRWVVRAANSGRRRPPCCRRRPIEALPQSRSSSPSIAAAFYCERLYRRRCDDRGEVRRRLSARNLRASPFERAPPRLAPHSGPKSVPLEPNAILARRPQRPTPTAQSRRPHRGVGTARARNSASTTRSRSPAPPTLARRRSR